MVSLPIAREPTPDSTTSESSIGAALPLELARRTLHGEALVESLLTEQRSLSAVESFSAWHEQSNGSHNGHAIGRMGSIAIAERYSSLLPATPPGPGQQYAFEVDLDRCSGCKACVVACHTLNGLDETETWRDVGLLVGGSRVAPVMQHVTAACHHCLEPACMIACPVNAYEKDPVTGIVKHLDDQCFGCQYCTMACPYDVPKYHPGKGIVRKCDMCSSRLAVGEAPACVQACPNEAIMIRVVEQTQVVDDAEASVFLPAAPDPQFTLPTTVYKTKRAFPRNLLPADYFRVNPQHAHWPLVVMLVLTQLSVGAYCAGLLLESFVNGPLMATLRPLHAIAALVFGLLALGASLFHLGRPHLAFRAVLGLRHSWLSREIVAFGAFAGLAALYSTIVFMDGMSPVDGEAAAALAPWVQWLGWCVAVVGVVAVFCSTMIYVFPRRECWSLGRVGTRFVGTSALLGIAALWLTILASTLAVPTLALFELIHDWGPTICWTLFSVASLKLAWELAILRHLWPQHMSALKRSAILMTGDLSKPTLARFTLGAIGGLALPALVASASASVTMDHGLVSFVILSGLLFVACLSGELLERYLFFAACAAPRMPGGIR
jgi:formate dehydrogenase iron-sulfur subunit